ncbi:hypothetical protein [Halorubrum aethiopicum]|uniref:hypothetical protein n=1 Tax=Halorubrum aethiopicum TaxID=1758255 RepID=UPI0012FEC5AE|nr:hypothetical protein [Halorubrum aethiopicum]
MPNSDKNGYYIQANVGAGAPITLQVSDLAARIFKDNGYGDADTVPTKLVWAMYDVNLVSTSNSTETKGMSANVYKAFNHNGVPARLSEQTRRELVQYLTDYRGPQRRRVRRLRTELETTKSSGNGKKITDEGTTTDERKTYDVDTSDLGYGFIDSLRAIWRHALARIRD